MPQNRTNIVKEMLEHTTNFDDHLHGKEDPLEIEEPLDNELKTHIKVKNSLVGTLVELKKNYSKVLFQATQEMTVDELGLIHSGFIFGAAEYAAVAAVNEENVVVISGRSKFFAPAKIGDIITFEAQGKFEDARKREIKVVGTISEIKVFEGVFQAILLDRHILQTKIDELHASFNPKDFL